MRRDLNAVSEKSMGVKSMGAKSVGRGRYLFASLIASLAAACAAGGSGAALRAPADATADAPVRGATVAPSEEEIFHSGTSLRVLDRFQLEQVGPVGGGAQAVGIAPGGHVLGAGISGAGGGTAGLDGAINGAPP